MGEHGKRGIGDHTKTKTFREKIDAFIERTTGLKRIKKKEKPKKLTTEEQKAKLDKDLAHVKELPPGRKLRGRGIKRR